MKDVNLTRELERNGILKNARRYRGKKLERAARRLGELKCEVQYGSRTQEICEALRQETNAGK